MVLTTIDSAVYSATQVPKGPVHINCSFREPLEDIPCEWTLDCLKGLDLWISKAKPFTQYINIHNFHAFGGFHGKFVEIVEIIQNSCRGLLVIGAIHTEDEIWAALVLAKHLKWPVITDILSGLRLRKVLTSVSDIEKHIFFVDHFDHALFSDAVRSQAQPDVVVQIGSRMTSKRIAQLLEACSLCSYILVENHPHRHDPSHIITHRVQSTICEFADALIKIDFPRKTGNWNSFLQVVNKMVEWEIEFQIHAENTMTEPHVAHVIMEALRNDAALFIGNSMVIRDADMYGRGNTKDTINMSHVMSNWKVPCQFIRVAGNRGASGIDGLLSTAVGFATGCKKRVLCVVGDMSFLHDTNGLAILNQRISRKPITILVINNHGGAIFSLLPVAGMTQPRILNQYFYTSHNISINNLCKAHSLKHLHVQTKEDLQNALLSAQQSQTDCIIEVESSIKSNAIFHRILTKSARQAADCAMNVLTRFTYPNNVFNGIASCKINRMEYSLYRIQLSAPCTSTFLKEDRKKLHREGFVLSLFLDDGSVGFGEVAPTEIHKEDLLDVEEQLRFLLHMVHGAEISYLLSLLRGSFSSWIWRTLGIPSSSIFPSVRCGMEMAILHALAAKQGCYLVDVISGYGSSLMETSQLVKRESIINKSSPKVQICALLDSDGTPKQIAHIIAQLSNAGFKTIKLKVARRTNPDEDAAVIQEIRKEVGYGINLRADANRIWTYEEAIQFGSHLKCCDLQYIEEPVRREDDIIRFCEETGLPAALDETIDNIEGDPLDKLQHFVHPRIVALVIKPSMVGGFENAMKIAKWAHWHDKMAVISCAFESSLSLSAYVQFASYIESQNKVICRMMNKELPMTVAHGLGTYRWLREDLSTRPLKICVDPNGDTVEAAVEDAGLLLQDFQINHEAIQRSYKEEQFRIYQTMITHDGFSCSFTIRDSGPHELNNIIIFLHGYLGTSEDWIPIMKALSVTARCISIDLPGHGGSRIQQHVDKGAEKEISISIELIANMLHKLITEISSERVVLVGYSMGARIALYMALRYTKKFYLTKALMVLKINGAVIISGSPGLRDELGKRNRINQDDAKARYLLSHGLQSFLEAWYAADLWFSLRNHPHFQQIVDTRARHKDITNLARILSDSSVGRQPSLWEDLKHCKMPLLLVSGEKDAKFKQIAHQMHRELISTSSGRDSQVDYLTTVVEVPDCGHVVHLENPLPLINAVRKFFNRLRKRRSSNANNLQVSRWEQKQHE
ncbi:hypothetical protein QJS10_CPA05g02086 [Acorus calamus]|uniref:Mandelate racemase/muconate lactonizing enzyme C-terminal domain-containing protein n=1 Tax=Acorus calamus TaxID=4465 RepID=A0AAV9ER78_ACOCL|nr:hypothetical protein QJS10_CPA05g02086 [Acorus calamus]